MKRTVQVLHLNDAGQYEQVFEWITRKTGTSTDVLDYLFNKFKSDPPAKYNARPLRVGDRLQITLDEGPFAGETTVFEMISGISLRKIG